MKDNFSISNLNRFDFADIDDLEAAAITGGASVTVTANANAYGSISEAYTNTNTVAADSKLFSVALGEGLAFAVGENSSTNVNPSGSGDKVKTISKTIDAGNQSISFGAVLAYSRKY